MKLEKALAIAKEFIKPNAFINGKWISRPAGSFTVLDKGTLQPICEQVPNGTTEMALDAIQAAKAAFPAWSGAMAKERAVILREVARLHHANIDALGALITMESGKPLKEARGEIAYGASYFEFFAEECKRHDGYIIPTTTKKRELFAIKQPIGVASLLTPWNFPNAMLARKAAAALAAGCTVVAKPAEDTPLSALAMAELLQRAGLPAGVFNVVPCARSNVAAMGEVLCTHPDVRKISFTGSTNVGKLLLKHAAGTGEANIYGTWGQCAIHCI